jgi:hypothetical protein
MADGDQWAQNRDFLFCELVLATLIAVFCSSKEKSALLCHSIKK